MFNWLSIKWRVFAYNFSWDDYASYLNGNIAKSSFIIPIIGYAVIFNDYVTDEFTFENLTNEVQTTFYLEKDLRLRLIFFAFLFLAGANLCYRVFRPHAMKIGETFTEYADYHLNNVPSHVFLRLHQEVKTSDYDPSTIDGKYYDDDWELFWREAHWSQSGQNLLDKDTPLENLHDYGRVDYEQAKKRHKSLLLSILRETYFRETTRRRPQLAFCLFIATIGYSLLLIPSIDLTLRVIELTFFG